MTDSNITKLKFYYAMVDFENDTKLKEIRDIIFDRLSSKQYKYLRNYVKKHWYQSLYYALWFDNYHEKLF